MVLMAVRLNNFLSVGFPGPGLVYSHQQACTPDLKHPIAPSFTSFILSPVVKQLDAERIDVLNDCHLSSRRPSA